MGKSGRRFQMMESATELHKTPFGATSEFRYCLCKVG